VRAPLHLLPTGEAAKTGKALAATYGALVKAGLGRDSGIVALGGGAVTDAAGFAAATYLRGVPWISAPTTLLGQVDSGIGGKVGIDLPEGKNLVGAIWQPARVVCDLDVLATLSHPRPDLGARRGAQVRADLRAGAVALTCRPLGPVVAAGARVLEDAVRRCARHKARIVGIDARETKGPRELLNFDTPRLTPWRQPRTCGSSGTERR